MKLENSHREKLISIYRTTLFATIEANKSIDDNEVKQEIQYGLEVEVYLNEKRMRTIEKALIKNEIE